MSCSSCYLVNKPLQTPGMSAYETARQRDCPKKLRFGGFMLFIRGLILGVIIVVAHEKRVV